MLELAFGAGHANYEVEGLWVINTDMSHGSEYKMLPEWVTREACSRPQEAKTKACVNRTELCAVARGTDGLYSRHGGKLGRGAKHAIRHRRSAPLSDWSALPAGLVGTRRKTALTAEARQGDRAHAALMDRSVDGGGVCEQKPKAKNKTTKKASLVRARMVRPRYFDGGEGCGWGHLEKVLHEQADFCKERLPLRSTWLGGF